MPYSMASCKGCNKRREALVKGARAVVARVRKVVKPKIKEKK